MTNNWLGFQVFFVVMYVLFQILFTIGVPFVDMIDTVFGTAFAWAGDDLGAAVSHAWAMSFVWDGVISGVGSG